MTMRVSFLLAFTVVAAACGVADTGPIALDDRIVTEPGVSVEHDLLQNDRAPVDGSLTLESVGGGTGSVVILDDRRVRYTPPATGDADSFTYVALGSDGTQVEATVEIMIGSTGSTSVPTTLVDDTTTTSSSTPTSTSTSTSTSSSTTAPPELPQIDPTRLEFGTVAIGASSTLPVTLTAGDAPWTPDFSEFDLVPDVSIVHECGEIERDASCEVQVTWTPSSLDEFDVTLKMHPDVPVRIFGTAAFAPPAWITPTDGQRLWFDLLRDGITVEIGAVPGSDGYDVVAQVCGGDDCVFPLLVDQIGDSTQFFIGSESPAELQVVFDAILDEGVDPVLELTAAATLGDGATPDSTIAVTLVEDPAAVQFIDFDPESPADCFSALTVTLNVESFTLYPREAVLHLSRADPDGDLPVDSASVNVDPGASTLTVDVDSVDGSFDTIRLEFENPSGVVSATGVTNYEVGGCFE